MRISAFSSGGQYFITAIRLYIDNQPVTTLNSATLDTYANLGAGAHNVTVVAWNTAGQSFTHSVNVKVGGTAVAPSGAQAGVTISSPGPSVTTSPLHFVASATPASGRSIVAMAVYLDNQLKQMVNGNNVDTYISTGAGTHYAVVQSWDSKGTVSKNAVTVSVGVPSSPSQTQSSNPPPAAGNSGYASDLASTSSWLATQFSPTGALLYSTTAINPYYSNLAASGLVKDPARYVQVENWMRWYISHLNRTDRWGLGGTMYDYNIVNGKEVATGNADSTDSYAATFLSLAYAYYATGNPAAQSYVRSIASDLNLIGQVLAKTQQLDGLTWAKPDYKIKYLMDNAEVYRGLADAAALFGSMGDPVKQVYYSALATRCQLGMWSMWMGNKWAVYKDGIGRYIGPDMGKWYPDASAQMFPVLYGVVPGSDSRAKTAYDKFNKAWPGWPQLSFNSQDPFPWVMVADAAALMGDSGRVGQYAESVRAKYINKGFPWTWYSMEGGWYMRLTNYMEKGGTF